MEHRRTRRAAGKKENDQATFFFRNFPDRCSPEELQSHFEVVGKVVDIYLPAKKDKKGNRFGFVRFRKQGDEYGMLEKLNKVWIGSYIIRAWKPKFDRPEFCGREKAAKAGNERGGTGAREGKFRDILRKKEGPKYSEVLFRNSTSGEDVRVGGNGGGERIETLEFQSTEQEGQWLKGAHIGYLKEKFSWNDHREELRSECAGILSLKNIGNNLILLQSEREQDTAEVIKGLDEWSEFWFEWWREWRKSDVCQNRIVWTKWIGVPLQAWSERFFGLGCSKFGRLVEMHEVTANKVRLDHAFIKVSTGLSSVDRCFPCKINGVQFSIRIEEFNGFEKEEWVGGESESDFDSSEAESWPDVDSIEALLKYSSDGNFDGDSSVNDGEEEEVVPHSTSCIEKAATQSSSGQLMSEACVRGEENIQKKVGPEDADAGQLEVLESPRTVELNGGGLGDAIANGGPGGGGSCVGPKGKEVSLNNSILFINSNNLGSYSSGNGNVLEKSREMESGQRAENCGGGVFEKGSSEEGGRGSSDNVTIVSEQGSVQGDSRGNVEGRNLIKISEGRDKGRNKKHDSKNWKEFIDPMISPSEKLLRCNKGRKARKGNRGGKTRAVESVRGHSCWDFGKKMGLKSMLTDDKMAKLLEGGDAGRGGLGDREKEVK